MANKPKPSNGLMYQVLRTEQLIAQLRYQIAPFRELSPKIVAVTPTAGVTEEQQVQEDCLKQAYCMLVEIQFLLSNYDDPDNPDNHMADDEEDDTTTPNPEEDEDECE
jgi:hypothetical protein